MKEKNKYAKAIYVLDIIFGLLVGATIYVLFCPIGGIGSDTISLWDYYTNDIYQIFSAMSGDSFKEALTLRKILIWPCAIGDIACIYTYFQLIRKAKAASKE